MREYDLIADWYQADRRSTIGVKEALDVAATLPAGALILDLGCGIGVPITKALSATGHRVVGLDSSSGMLAHFRTNVPGVPAVRADARACPFASSVFDAVISWGMIFHLPPKEQRIAFASVARVLKSKAPFLFTAAEKPDASEAGITGEMNGVTFPYYAVPSYETILADHGFTLTSVYDDPGVSTYYLAHKSA